jgi:hypothetical protein
LSISVNGICITFAILAKSREACSAVTLVVVAILDTASVNFAKSFIHTQACHHISAILDNSSKVAGISVLNLINSLLNLENSCGEASTVFLTLAKADSKLIAVSIACFIVSNNFATPFCNQKKANQATTNCFHIPYIDFQT